MYHTERRGKSSFYLFFIFLNRNNKDFVKALVLWHYTYLDYQQFYLSYTDIRSIFIVCLHEQSIWQPGSLAVCLPVSGLGW